MHVAELARIKISEEEIDEIFEENDKKNKKEKNNLLLGVALTFILSLVFSASGLSLLLAIMLQKSALHISIPVIFIVSAFLGFVFFINIKKKYDILKSFDNNVPCQIL